MERKKRVLWLLNHTSLRKFEVPLLVEVGYEVYCPKIFQVGAGDGSASVTYEYDKTLTIPSNVLEKMNQVDFYEYVTEEIMSYMNEYFDIVMIHYFPTQFETVIRNFKGVIVFQAFGLLGQTSYTEYIIKDLGISALSMTQKLGKRFFFAQAYPHLYEVECKFFQSRRIDMPLGLAKAAGKRKKWTGGDSRFLFVLPRINASNYFRSIYSNYTKEFRGMDYVIGGAQPIAVPNDPHVSGYMSQDEYDRVMNCCAALFYHSQEKNHIHYHPFEAISNGMPVVFMAGGMMDLLGGKGLPGRCETIKEAKQKLRALCNGDKRLIHDICSTQDVLLEHFDYENCYKKWQYGMSLVDEQVKRLSPRKETKKIAVILPQPYLGGVLDYTIRLIECVLKGMRSGKEQYSIVVGYPDDEVFKKKDYFRALRREHVEFHTFTWATKSAHWVMEALQLMGMPTMFAQECCVLDDGVNFFEDCDYLIFTADRIPAVLFTSKPYTVVAHDYIQRYCPEIMQGIYEDSFIQAVRRADRIYVTTPSTLEDCVQYGGVKKENVLLTPFMFDYVEAGKAAHRNKRHTLEQEDPQSNIENEAFFLWATNTAIHKNHKQALAGLSEYYSQGGTFFCVITGVNTDLLDVSTDEESIKERLSPYTLELRKLIKEDCLLKENLIVMGNLPKNQYLDLLKRAKFTFHPGYGDNGNGAAVDAACLGVPTVCSDYPAMRYMDEYISLGAHFFDPFDANSIGGALMEAEEKWESYRQGVPSKDKLKEYTVEGKYQEMYEIVRKTVEGFA